MPNYAEPRVALPTYGRQLLQQLPEAYWEYPIVLTQPEPWEMVRHLFPAQTQVHMVTTMEHRVVQEVTASFKPGSAVFGIGGGSAADHAKYVGWKTGMPLVIVPTILSVDAAYTKAIGVREGSKVRYVGEVYPDYLLIDFEILRSSPILLNRSGVGDLISIFTALWDWKEAGERVGEFYDAEIAAHSQVLLDRLLAGATDIRDITDEGLRLMSDLYVGEVRLCEMVGNSRPEEGSEHYLAYCLESLTQGHYLHGQLVGVCVLIAGYVQGQDIEPMARFLKQIDLNCTLGAIGSNRTEMLKALTHIHTYVQMETQLLPGVFHFRSPIDEAEADRILTALEPHIGR